MRKLPTDLEILNAIYERYYDAFASFTKDARTREAKIYIPLDIDAIARDLRVDGDIIFGRLYYDMQYRFGYRHDDGISAPLFTIVAGKDRHCINFPYAASVLAGLRDEHHKYRTATVIAVVSLFVSAVSLAVSVLI